MKNALDQFYQPRTILLTLSSDFIMKCTERQSALKYDIKGKSNNVIQENNAKVISTVMRNAEVFQVFQGGFVFMMKITFWNKPINGWSSVSPILYLPFDSFKRKNVTILYLHIFKLFTVMPAVIFFWSWIFSLIF